MRTQTLIGITLAAGMAGMAQAEVVVHLNPAGAGHFEWWNGQSPSSVYLDIRLGATEQGLGVTPSTVLQDIYEANSQWRLGGAVQPTGTFEIHNGGASDQFAIGLSADTVISDSIGVWDQQSRIYHAAVGSWVPEGEESFLGVRFSENGSTYYGWIGVVRVEHHLTAFAWGYETDADVPIAAGAGIPTPGAIPALALGGLAVARRRRR